MFLAFLSEVLTFLTASSSKQHKFDPPPDTPQHSTPPTNIHIPTSRKRHDSIKIARMNSTSHVTLGQDLPSAKDAGALRTYTGFSEPLSPDRNTTLPHPDADTSKNATIEAADVPVERTHSRGSFFRSRGHAHRSTNSGKIDPLELGLYDDIQYVDGSTKKQTCTRAIETHVEKRNDLVQPLTNGVEHAQGSGDPQESVRQEERNEQDDREGGRKKGVLKKLNLHQV